MWLFSKQYLIAAGIPEGLFRQHPLGWALETWCALPLSMDCVKFSSPEWLYQKEAQDYSMVMSILAFPLFSPTDITNGEHDDTIGYIVTPLHRFSEGVFGQARACFDDLEKAKRFATAEYYRERLQNIQQGEQVCDWPEFHQATFKPFVSPIHQCAEQGSEKWWKDGKWSAQNHKHETLIDTFERVIFSFSPYGNNYIASKSLTLLANKIQLYDTPWERLHSFSQKIQNNSEKYSSDSMKAWQKKMAILQEKRLNLIGKRTTLTEEDVEKI